MADKKISQLTDLPAASVSPSNDVLAIVDTNVTETKKITAKALVDGALNAGTANGLVYLNGSKEATTGSIISYDGTTFKVDDAVVINESGGDNDTRIEGDTDANLFFVDASTDRIGIGTNTPDALLNVDGVASFGTGSAAAPSIAAAGDLNTGIFFPAADTIGFSEGGSERMRLNSSGNLGLGVTPKAWTNTRAFDIGAFGAVSCDTATSGVLSFAYNCYAEGASTWKYKGSGSAGLYQATESHKWFTAASGTAFNTITFTQAMTLDASGNLGIGATSPGAKLDVRGSAIFNEDGADVDFRVESDTNAHALFVDAGNSRVGVNNSTPAVALDVTGQIRASTGILFGSDTAAANALDDYEEGTWTPVVTGRTTAGTGTYSRQNGYYTKIGNLVRVHIDIVLTAHTGTGGFVISLPFTSEATLGNNPVFAVNAVNLTFSNQLFAAVDRNAATCAFLSMSSGASNTTINIDGSCDINVTGTYIVA